MLVTSLNEAVCRSIGVSNFSVDDLKTLLAKAEVKPAVNQVSWLNINRTTVMNLITSTRFYYIPTSGRDRRTYMPSASKMELSRRLTRP